MILPTVQQLHTMHEIEPNPLRRNKILIVDDQDYNINAIRIILKYVIKIDPSILIDTALNGFEALEKMKINVR